MKNMPYLCSIKIKNKQNAQQAHIKNKTDMKAIITMSLGQTRKAADAIEDCHMICDQLYQVSSSEWETDWYNEEDENEKDAHNQLIYDIQDLFRRAGVSEYDIDEVEE